MTTCRRQLINERRGVVVENVMMVLDDRGGKREEWNERLGQAKKGKLLFTAKTGAYWFVKTSKISIKSKNTSSYYF